MSKLEVHVSTEIRGNSKANFGIEIMEVNPVHIVHNGFDYTISQFYRVSNFGINGYTVVDVSPKDFVLVAST